VRFIDRTGVRQPKDGMDIERLHRDPISFAAKDPDCPSFVVKTLRMS